MNIVQLTAENLPQYRYALAALMIDAIKNNMTTAFQNSRGMQRHQDAERYFHSLRDQMARHDLLMWIAIIDSSLVGSVQMGICQRPDGQNRAEVLQLLVHSGVQHEKIGQRLMQALEQKAESHQRGLLYLDVIAGSSAEEFYRSHGYHYLGELPDYALCSDGHSHPSAIYYKRLRTGSAENVVSSY
ncbi:GNAT family N-acetyltransferase [Pantoea sp. BIGb0393]|uniref:GNAT family N-acetyltransferase n=1 Tax=Pantoea nemavictus TaxID=2726955 RepID=A0ABU8PSZ8_9GAMM|nr:GNAT family N-acetyltransferase [Pantoea nemavictus]MBA0036678.1 GNAT family N-acetyltransferase [Pantoea nemavictus]